MSRPIKLIRWTLKQASEEFGINIQTLTRRLKSNGVVYGEDKMYSTRQIFDALTVEVDLKKAQLENIRRDSALKATRDSILKKEYVPIALVDRIWKSYVVDLREKIKQTSIPQIERNGILHDLEIIPIENYYIEEKNNNENENENEE